MKRRIFSFALAILFILFTFSGCGTDMPFNGDIAFNEISATIPDTFVRDSTQSSEDAWIFEQGGYKKCIILTRNDIQGDASEALEDYAEYFEENAADVEKTTFLNNEAVFSSYTKEEQFCQEVLFAYNGSFYAIALRGGSEEEFNSLLDTVKIIDKSDSSL